MKKFKIIALIISTLVLITLLFIVFFDSNQNGKYEKITNFLDTNPAAVITLRSVLGDVNIQPGNGSEIIIQLNPLLQDDNHDIQEDSHQLIELFLDNNADFFTEQASSLREGLDFQSLTLTLYYTAEDGVIQRSFDAR